jgi:hypothetical protein
MMALVEEDWLKQLYGVPYRNYCMQTARFSRRPGTACSRRAEEAVTPNELSNALQ